MAYELWGTGIAERRSQKALKAQFAHELATPTTVTGAPPNAIPPSNGRQPADLGNAVAEIRIPKIGLDKFVVEGVGVPDLKQGPGHYPDTPMPGQAGNAAIAGHRTTYGAPFGDLDRLSAGDPILITTRAGSFEYQVDRQFVVSPSEVSVLDRTPDNRLTLTTCNPKYSAAQRLIVVAKMTTPLPEAAKATAEAQPRPNSQARPHALAAGLSGKASARGPAIAWGALAALVWALTWWLGRKWRRVFAYFLGTPVFLVVLFVFFENVSRLLPANV